MTLLDFIYPKISVPPMPPRCAWSSYCAAPAIDVVGSVHYCTWHSLLVPSTVTTERQE
ncbi:MAG: hypothetical protein ACYCXA_13900 [Actinomycetes bacterium]